jgi:hypothetical protein
MINNAPIWITDTKYLKINNRYYDELKSLWTLITKTNNTPIIDTKSKLWYYW